MAFLDLGRLGRGHMQADRAPISHRPAGLAGKPDDLHARRVRRFDGAQDVLRIAGSGEGVEHIALCAQRLDLPREQMLVAVVVADRGENAGVGCQCDTGQSRAVVIEAADQFPRPVLGVGRAAAIAGE